ncbi:MAG TPA: hypothetical protein VJX67_13165, partial [Blastocatellia bacterium]|nr:hypothetical protein [Blastocatellia bacterium]
MFVIFHGYRLTLGKVLGATALKCHRCQQVQPFYVHELWERNHINYMPFGSTRRPDILVCGFCREWTSLPKPIPIVDVNWTRTEDLQKLVDRTNPA